MDLNCPDCVKKNKLEAERLAVEANKMQAEAREEAIRKGPSERLKNLPRVLSGILPRKFAAMEYPMPEILRQFLPPSTSGVCLYGKSGTGKTTAIAMMIREYLITCASEIGSADTWGIDNLRLAELKKRRIPGIGDWEFISYPEFIRSLQRSFKSNDNSIDILAEVMDAPYLVIDDLGAEKPTDYVRQETYTLINHREMNLLPTYITTNFSLDHLDKNIDPRIASRIAGMCKIIHFEGKDKRLEK